MQYWLEVEWAGKTIFQKKQNKPNCTVQIGKKLVEPLCEDIFALLKKCHLFIRWFSFSCSKGCQKYIYFFKSLLLLGCSGTKINISQPWFFISAMYNIMFIDSFCRCFSFFINVVSNMFSIEASYFKLITVAQWIEALTVLVAWLHLPKAGNNRIFRPEFNLYLPWSIFLFC